MIETLTRRFPALRASVASLTPLALAALSACDTGQGYNRAPESVSGQLGNGRFVYRCDSSVTCNDKGDAATFPENVAVGARFAVEFIPNGASADLLERAQGLSGYVAPEAASTLYTQSSPRGLVALRAGFSTLFVRDAEGRVADFQTVHQQEVARLALADVADTTALETRRTLETLAGRAGGRLEVRPYARSASGEALAGVLAYTFTSADPAVAFVEASDEDSAVIVFRAAGATTLKVEGGGVAQDVAVVVDGAGAPAPVDGGAEGGAR